MFTHEEFRRLAQHVGAPSLSVTMTTHRCGSDVQGDAVMLRNLMRRGESELLEEGWDTTTIESMTAPAWDLVGDQDFWRRHGEGLALYVAPDALRLYRLPIPVAVRVAVGDRFHIRPLLHLLEGEGTFHLLTLSQNKVRFFVGTRTAIEERELTGVAPSVAEGLGYDISERQLPLHSGVRHAGKNGQAAVVHANGGAEEDMKKDLVKYFRQVDKGVRDVIGAADGPLLLAGVEYLLPMYRRASRYHGIVDGGVVGNPESLAERELHQRAWAIVEPMFHSASRKTVERFHELLGTGRVATMTEDVEFAARDGRVESLLVTMPDMSTVGTIDSAVVREEEKAINAAIIATMMNGGEVFAVSAAALDGASEVAAILRY